MTTPLPVRPAIPPAIPETPLVVTRAAPSPGVRTRALKAVYDLSLHLLLGPALLRAIWRSRPYPEQAGRWRERLGLLPPNTPTNVLWVHAVSVGEVHAATPLVRGLLRAHPGIPLLLSTGTHTGATQVQALFGTELSHCYLPFDTRWAVDRFIARCRPRVGVILETEIWPNLYRACAADKVPLLLVNARLSERSARRYRWLGSLLRETLELPCAVAAQTPEDAARFEILGVPPQRLHLTGNLKYDAALTPAQAQAGAGLRSHLSAALRRVWLAGSTHAGEDDLVLEAHRAVQAHWPNALLVLAPRHPERCDAVEQRCTAHGFRVLRRSRAPTPDGADVYLVDTLGELAGLFGAAEVALVGGSLLPGGGGHNLIEPALAGVPVLFGPHMQNFGALRAAVLAAGAGWEVGRSRALSDAVITLLADPTLRQRMGAAGRNLVRNHGGASARTLALVDAALRSPQGAGC